MESREGCGADAVEDAAAAAAAVWLCVSQEDGMRGKREREEEEIEADWQEGECSLPLSRDVLPPKSLFSLPFPE